MNDTNSNDTLIRLESQLQALVRSNDKIERGIYGNGVKGLKERVKALEIQFWIIIVITLPLAVAAFKDLIFD